MYLPHYTYEDYCQWEGRWELIEGIPIAMSPLPVPRHQYIGGVLFALFDELLPHQCRDCVAYPPIDWKVKDDTVLQPDFLVVCGEVNKPYLDFPPALVAEILSPSSIIKDRNAKFSIYQSQHVRYYLILDVKLEKLEVFELINGKYELVANNPATFDFSFQDHCKTTISFQDLWH